MSSAPIPVSPVARIGIWMGDSFAEIASTVGPSPGLTSRWFHPKKSLSDVLKETIAALPEGSSGEIVVATSRAEMSVARKQGSEPALLVTAGFETWIRHGSVKAASLSLKATRDWFPTSTDKIFGIEERIQSDGSIVKPLASSELDFLVAKLELLKTKEVAIAFVHGEKFPAHEREAAELLRAKGFNVTCSHELPNASALSDLARIRLTVESAFAETVIQDDLSSMKTAAGENWTLQFWNPNGLGAASAASVRGGVEAALANALKSHDLAYYFGLEEFLGFRKGAPYLLPVQPTCQIGAGAWPFPTWTGVDRGYEPGPMLFGKSHQLTLLDALFLGDHLNGEIEGFSDRVQLKSSPRIIEALFTLGKNLAEPGRRAADPKEIAEDLVSSAIERLAMDLAFNSSTRVFIAGPLASTILPLLEKRRSDMRFSVDPSLTIATASLGAK